MEMIIKVLWEKHIRRVFFIDLFILFINYLAFGEQMKFRCYCFTTSGI